VAMTTITCSFNDLKKLADKYKDIKALDKNNVIKGWYIEGPFISPEKKGAHPIKLIKPINLEILNYIKKTLPKVTKILAVAPENANNIKYISQLLKDYFISIGHSNANYATAEKAFNLGARRIVHLYNAMAGFNHRVPTLLNAIFNNDQVSCELICDFIHVAKEVIMNTYRIIGSERIMLISDSLSSKGLKDGTYNI
jgi:N-acetylglucosamine-6-phosphate deacetylase